MTGAEHYRAAEQLLVEAGNVVRRADDACPDAARMIAEAQARATLALAAATALLAPQDPNAYLSPDLAEWQKTAGVPGEAAAR